MNNKYQIGKKIVVVGTTGSGKTTFARKLSAILNIPHVELDNLFWKAGWEESGNEEFRERIREATGKQRWIIDGNYPKSQDLTVEKADTVIWLDCSKTLSLYRVLKRSLNRIYTKEPLWDGNRETLYRLFAPKVSILYFAYRSYIKKKTRYNKLFSAKNIHYLVRIRNRIDENEFWESIIKNPA